MTDERYGEVERDVGSRLTPEELGEGWHFCADWDDMLVGPGMDELDSCLCTKFPPPWPISHRVT